MSNAEQQHEPTPPAPGAFSRAYATWKRWRLDDGLEAAMWLVNIYLQAQGIKAPRWLDLGAGAGKYVARLIDWGCDAVGLDGIPGIGKISQGLVQEADLTKPDALQGIQPADCAMCIEVGEHVPAEHEAALLDSIAQATRRLLLISWATPGQKGRQHINCRTPEHVQAELEKRGLQRNELLTSRARKLAGRHWQHKLLVMERTGPAEEEHPSGQS